MCTQERNSAANGDGFWATVLRNRSEGKLRRLLNSWLQESLAPSSASEGGSARSESEAEVSDAKRRAYEQQGGGGLGSDPQDIGLASEYAYHAKDSEGTPRTNSPDDVMTTNLGGGEGSSPNGAAGSPSSGAPPPPEPSGATGGHGGGAPAPALPDIGATPSTVEVFRGEAVAAQLESGLRANRARGSGSGSFGGGSSGGGSGSSGGSSGGSGGSVGISSQHGASAAQVEHASHALAAEPVVADRSISCTECQIKIEGPVFMLNDHPYCCQRHRLLAYHKYERGQINARGLSASAPAILYAQSGLRASFQAWI